MSATATGPRMTREILEDRWQGAMVNVGDGDPEDPSELYLQLTGALLDAARAVARIHGDDLGGVVEEMYKAIRAGMIQAIDDDGLAR